MQGKDRRSHFVDAMLDLFGGAVILAAFLLIEWGLMILAGRTLEVESLNCGRNVIRDIYNGIQIGSAILVLAMFVIHSVAVFVQYSKYLWKK